MTVVEHPEVAVETLAQLGATKLLKGKKALVTGGSRGIGRATALALAQAGADVSINYQRCADLAEAACADARELGVCAHAYQCNISHEEDALAMIEQVNKDFGHIDILVNNAGITRDKSFVKMTHAMWDEVLGVNLTGVYNVTHAVLPGMIEAGWGRIVNVSSIVGQTGNFGQANYAVTKGGLIAFTMTLARELARKGITVNAVAPGFIETDMVKDMPDATMESVKAATPLGRLGRPEEVAAAIVFLAGPESSFITGQVIPVNGGMYM
jgi:3-oxoacyl-(acyl-carrier-protein) reductase